MAKEKSNGSVPTATAVIEVPLCEQPGGEVNSIFVTLQPRHRKFFKWLRQSLHKNGATYVGGNGQPKHVDSNAGAFHWILDHFEF